MQIANVELAKASVRSEPVCDPIVQSDKPSVALEPNCRSRIGMEHKEVGNRTIGVMANVDACHRRKRDPMIPTVRHSVLQPLEFLTS